MEKFKLICCSVILGKNFFHLFLGTVKRKYFGWWEAKNKRVLIAILCCVSFEGKHFIPYLYWSGQRRVKTIWSKSQMLWQIEGEWKYSLHQQQPYSFDAW